MSPVMDDFKRQELRRAILSSILGGVYKFGGVALAFFVMLLLAKKMDPVEFGIYSIGFSLANLAWPLATLGQPMSAVRFWPTFAERYDVPTANFVLLRGLKLITLGAVIMLAVFVLVSRVDIEVGVLSARADVIVWTGIFSVSLAYSQFLCFALRAQGLLNWSLTPRDVLWRVGVIGIALMSGEMTGLGGLALTGLVLGTVTLAQLLRMVTMRGPDGRVFAITRPPAAEIAAMRHAQWGLCRLDIARQWLQQAATLVVAFFLGPAAAGAFFAAQRLANLLSLVLVGTNQVSGPMIARDWHAGRKDDLQRLTTAMVVAATVSSLIGLIFFGLLGRWMLGHFDPAYRSAYWALMVFAFGQLVNSACGPNGHVLNLAGQERSLLKVSVIVGIANIVFTAVGAMFGGVLGAAIGSTLATILWNAWATVLCARRLGVMLVHPTHVRSILTTLKEIVSRRRAWKGKGK